MRVVKTRTGSPFLLFFYLELLLPRLPTARPLRCIAMTRSRPALFYDVYVVQQLVGVIGRFAGTIGPGSRCSTGVPHDASSSLPTTCSFAQNRFRTPDNQLSSAFLR